MKISASMRQRPTIAPTTAPAMVPPLGLLDGGCREYLTVKSWLDITDAEEVVALLATVRGTRARGGMV